MILSNRNTADWLHLMVIFRKQLEARLAEKIEPFAKDEFKIWHLPVLVNVAKEGITNKTLIEQLRLSKQALSKAQRELKQFGYITVHKGEDDKRTHLILLTAKGAALAKDLKKWIKEVEAEYESFLGEKRAMILKETMALLIAYNDKNNFNGNNIGCH